MLLPSFRHAGLDSNAGQGPQGQYDSVPGVAFCLLQDPQHEDEDCCLPREAFSQEA